MIALALLLAQAAVPSPVPVAPGAAAPGTAATAPRAGTGAADAPAPQAGTAASGTAAADTAQLYARKCAFCHADDGTGVTRKGKELRVPDFTSAGWQKHTRDEEITGIIEKGNRKRKMPAFAGKLTPEQIQAFVPYLRSLGRK